MIERQLQSLIERRLLQSPAVVLLGPRQVGKTTLAKTLAARHPPAVLLDLERESDRAALQQPELFFAAHRDQLLVLDEVQLAPQLFAALRPEIDADRRAGRFLLLGSASGDLLRQSGESLAGRVSYLELTPLLAAELPVTELPALQSLWLRGGFPLSYLAPDDEASYAWRQDFIRTFLQRDLPGMGVRVPAETLRRFWQMLAHLQGQLFNASQLGMSLGGASHSTATRYLDVLVDTMMVRRLPPHFTNIGKRLVKSPKVYLRDSGVLHSLLGVTSVNGLLDHPKSGASWEGLVVEQVSMTLPSTPLHFWGTQSGAEIDLYFTIDGRGYGLEIKRSMTPSVTPSIRHAIADLGLQHVAVVYPGTDRYALADKVEALPLAALADPAFEWAIPR